MIGATTGLRHRGGAGGAGSSPMASVSQARVNQGRRCRSMEIKRSMVESLALSLLSLPREELFARLNTISDKLLRKPFDDRSTNPKHHRGPAAIFKNKNEALQLAKTVTFDSSEEHKQKLLNKLTHKSFDPFKAFVEYAYPMMKWLQDDSSHFILNEDRRKEFSAMVGSALTELITERHGNDCKELAHIIGLRDVQIRRGVSDSRSVDPDVPCVIRKLDGYFESGLPEQFKEETADEYAKSMARSIVSFEGFMNRNGLLNHLDLSDFEPKLGAIFTEWKESEDEDIEAFFKREIQTLKGTLEMLLEPSVAKKCASTIFGLHFTLLVMGYNGLSLEELKPLIEEVGDSARPFEFSGSTVKLLDHIQKQTLFFRPVNINEGSRQETRRLPSALLLSQQGTPNAFKLLFKLIPHQDDIIYWSRDLIRASDHLVTTKHRVMSDDQGFLTWCPPIAVEGCASIVLPFLFGQPMHPLKTTVVSPARVCARQFLSTGLQLDQVPNDGSSLSTAQHFLKTQLSEYSVFVGSQILDLFRHFISGYHSPPSRLSISLPDFVRYQSQMSAFSNGLSFLKFVYDVCTHSEKRDPKQFMSKFVQCVMPIMMFYFLLPPEEPHYQGTD